ncbi:glycosyltransferase [Methylobacterium oxalidis]|uniref:Glycosyltransferase 2-like domain-containing protein n=1 Tax=Methylobacterium oxalidis TaxID=944322 RepID=A0A512JBP9_9HYPH|nr:glycosyltransferase [Methylobacterium oxalidis]GEP07380.1 hypothetical protein MOX02_54180 [Methylobacterium oxalidis]GJE33023.1 hypothetical protein LDDCCGHA_3222 [Methylobacterium oxalidis]GLS64490.1 hypothetical protein GCM10007888_28710 [Methylobacterium oxalidis]
MKICIATPDIIGPIKNGGVGTACTALAQALSAAGHDVDLFYTSVYYESGNFAEWYAYYAKLGIKLVSLDIASTPPVHPSPTASGDDVTAQSYHVYESLKSSSYDIIHFVDLRGLGYFTALAKHQGLCLARTRIFVTVHGPTLWSRFANAGTLDDITYLIRDRMERRLIEYADLLVTPSKYMKRWLEDNKWILPKQTISLPNLLPGSSSITTKRFERYRDGKLTELVFFGRMEPRKGLLLFCDAIDRIDGKLDPSITVTFLGKLGNQYSIEDIHRRASRWRRAVALQTGFDTFKAIEYLQVPGRLAVLAAIQDNSPYTVLECLYHKIPFIATEVGGSSELVADAYHEATFFQPTPADLADRILTVSKADILLRAEPAFDFDRIRRQHLALYETCSTNPNGTTRQQPAKPKAKPLITVNLLHYERPARLIQALKSIEAQDYDHVELIIVDNSSRSSSTIECLKSIESGTRRYPTEIIRMQENFYEPYSRNSGAARARGKYVLFMDDDNVAKPHELSTFCSVAEQTKFDVLTCFADQFVGDEPPKRSTDAVRRFVTMGDFGPLGILMNGYGDLNCFVNREKFLETGGFVVDGRFNHAEDWRFFVKAHTGGLRIGAVPEALFWYRVGTESPGINWRTQDRGGALDRAARIYLGEKVTEDGMFSRLAQGLFWRAVELERERKAAAAELEAALQKQTQLAELIQQMADTSAVLRNDLSSVIGFITGSLKSKPGSFDEETDRALAALERFSAGGV